MDIERLEELSECGRELYILNDENLIERIRSDNQLQNYLSDSVDAIDEAIARQSVTSEEVQRAINVLATTSEGHDVFAFYKSDKVKRAIDLAITALQAYQPKGE